MARIAVLSDIHGNLTALNAVIADAGEIDHWYCLGDTIGYGPYPVQCLKLIRDKAEIVLRGNHEDCSLRMSAHKKTMNDIALVGVRYSRSLLSLEQCIYLSTLVSSTVCPDFPIALAHGSFINPWDYVSSREQARRELYQLSVQIGVLGHTHVPFVYGQKTGLFEDLPDNLLLHPDEKFLVNVGSVGQPRDGDCRASYGLFTVSDAQITFSLRRVFYNIMETERALRQTKLPGLLYERLYRGE